MNKLQRWIIGKENAQLIEKLKAVQTVQGGSYQFVGGTLVWIGDDLNSYVRDAYQLNDIVYSAVMLVMDKVRMAPWGLYKVEDEDSLKLYQSEIQNKTIDWRKASKLRSKALVPIEKPAQKLVKLADLLKWANEYCTFNDLIAEGAGWKMITGNKYLWANILDAGANQGVPQELEYLPAQHTVIRAKTSWPQRALGYELNCGELRKFTKEEILHEKFWNPTYDINGSGLYGQSPLKAASRTITRNNAAKQAGSVQLQNNGAAGIAYVDNDKVSVDDGKAQAKLIKERWANEYSGADNFGKVAFAGTRFGYVQVGQSLKEMALQEVEEIDLRRLANIWGIPSVLLNDPGNKSWNNLTESEKALTSRCAMSHLVSARDNLNRKLTTDWGFKGVNVYVDFDSSVYSELQENLKEKWEWMRELPIKLKDKVDAMNFEIPDDPMMEEIVMMGNWAMLKDIVAGMGNDDLDMDKIDEELNKAGLKDYLKAVK